MRDKSEPATSVVCAVTASVGIPGDPSVPMPARLRYDAADPFAVRLSLGTARTGKPVDWVFARALLEEGMYRPTGIGNVLVSPPHRCHPETVGIVVRSATGAARIEVPAEETEDFLRRTHVLVPPGRESGLLDVDGGLAALMDSCE